MKFKNELELKFYCFFGCPEAEEDCDKCVIKKRFENENNMR